MNTLYQEKRTQLPTVIITVRMRRQKKKTWSEKVRIYEATRGAMDAENLEIKKSRM